MEEEFVNQEYREPPAVILLFWLLGMCWAVGVFFKAAGILPQPWIWILSWPVILTIAIASMIVVLFIAGEIRYYLKRKIRNR